MSYDQLNPGGGRLANGARPEPTHANVGTDSLFYHDIIELSPQQIALISPLCAAALYEWGINHRTLDLLLARYACARCLDVPYRVPVDIHGPGALPAGDFHLIVKIAPINHPRLWRASDDPVDPQYLFVLMTGTLFCWKLIGWMPSDRLDHGVVLKRPALRPGRELFNLLHGGEQEVAR